MNKYANGRWTEGKRRTFIVSALRSMFRKWPVKYDVLNAAYTGQKLNPKTNRVGKHYKCATCNGEFPSKEVQVDHIDPVIDPHVGWSGWDTFIDRLLCETEGLQVLCTSCHDSKTAEERKERSETKKHTKC